MTDRYRHPPFDDTGEHGPRDIGETTEATQHRYLNGPEMAGLPGYVVVPGGIWYASDDGREWRKVDDQEGQGS